jgi:hypothetical protein
MNKRDDAIFKSLMTRYAHQWDLNQYNRTNYDEDLEYYTGYRNPQNYPLAFNESFNRILPIIYTILARFMDQLYQSHNIVSVKPRKNQDLERAKVAEAILNFQLENLNSIDMQGGSYLTMYKWFFNALTFGKGIVKAYWRKEDRISPKRIALQKPNFDSFGNFQGNDIIDHVSMENQLVYDGPYLENLHNKIVVVDPQYKNIQQMPAVFIVYKKSIDYIKKMADRGIYNKKYIKELGWESTSGASSLTRDSNEEFIKSLEIEGAGYMSNEELKDKHMSPEVDIIEAYTRMIIDDAPYEVGSGVKIKGKEEEVVVHIGNYKVILSLQRNVYGSRPLFDIGCYMQPEMFWDIGLVRLTKGLQEQTNNIANMRLSDAMMRLAQMIRVDPDSDVDPKSLTWRPFGIFSAAEGEVEPLVMPDVNSNLFVEQEKFLESTIQDLTGMYDYNMGQTPQRQERVGVVYSIQSMGEARAKLMLQSMDHMGIRPLLNYMMLLNTFHLPSGSEYRVTTPAQTSFGKVFGSDLHADYDFAARYTSMEPAAGKQARLQQMLQLASVMLQNPWINQHQWWKTIFELGDIREAGYLLKTPQQFAQEQQAQQQMQMMAEAQAQRYETEGKLVTSQKDFVEDTALADQKFGHDLALKAVEGELASENANKRAD